MTIIKVRDLWINSQQSEICLVWKIKVLTSLSGRYSKYCNITMLINLIRRSCAFRLMVENKYIKLCYLNLMLVPSPFCIPCFRMFVSWPKATYLLKCDCRKPLLRARFTPSYVLGQYISIFTPLHVLYWSLNLLAVETAITHRWDAICWYRREPSGCWIWGY